MVNQEAFPSSNTVAAILVAAGSGTRMGTDGQPAKQFRLLAGKPVLTWSAEALLRCDKIGALVVVVGATDAALAQTLLPNDPRISIAIGGPTRTQSVRNGLAVLGKGAWTKLLVHDAARPGLSLPVIEEVIAALDEADAAAPALTMTDAVKEIGADGAPGAVRTIPRERLVRVQTPQAMRAAWIERAYAQGDAGVDDIGLLESHGAKIAFTLGRPELMKITHPEDFAAVSKLLAPAAAAMRIGNGFDVHGFEPGDAVILCGVRIPHTKKLEGHSDADAGWHALTDAILGAAALGDIGDHFPPSDPRWKGQDSRTFLVHAVKLAAERGLQVVNADITLLCEKPKIAPHREAMRQRTAEALGVDISCVSIKATTTEKLGFLGREEGIAAQAVVLLAER